MDEEDITLPETTAVDQAALQDRAWQMVAEAMNTGKMTLATGRVMALDEDGMLKLVQWLASRAAKARKLVPLPEEFKRKKGG